MPDFNPKEMDALFREGAKRHEFEYNPDAWALMEDRLDRKDRKRKFLFFLLGGSLLVIGIISIFYWNVSSTDSKEAFAATKIEEHKREQQSVEVASFDGINASKQEKTQQLSIETTKTLTAATKSNSSIASKKEYISTDSKESMDNIGAQNSIQSENTGNLVSNEIVSIDSPIGTKGDIGPTNKEHITDQIVNESKTDEAIIYEDTIEPFEAEILEVANIRAIEITPFDRQRIKFSQLDIEIDNNSSVPPPSLPNRFALTLFANPEWSSVGLFEESRIGWSFGSKIGYQFADKFELSLGFAYSRKIYKGGGEAYIMEGGWFNDIQPQRMDAKCDVIEIPIALSYHMNGYRNSGFFADIGINSYMLHSEWYGFEYNDALIRPNNYKEVNQEDENSHLIGVGRIAVGYQNVLSNKTTIQIAPYLQFPLTGIGAGKVNVYSSGVQLAVKFNTQ